MTDSEIVTLQRFSDAPLMPLDDGFGMGEDRLRVRWMLTLEPDA